MKNVVLDMTKLSEAEQQKYATEFSEGSNDLKELLLYMWQNGINTHASCAGHAPQKFGNSIAMLKPYIMFDISSLKSKEIKDLLSKLILLNETKDKPCLDISIQAQLFDGKRFMNTVAEGRIEDDVFERHSMSIHFVDGDNTHYKELLDVLQSVKSQDKSLINKLKDKFKQVTKIGTQFKDFIDIVSQVNEMSLKDKAGNEEFKSINGISLGYEKGKLYQDIATKRPNGWTLFQDNEARGPVFECAPGYATRIDSLYPWIPDKFFTMKDGDAIEISSKEAQHLKPYKINEELEYHGDFSAPKMNEILKSLNQEQSLTQ